MQHSTPRLAALEVRRYLRHLEKSDLADLHFAVVEEFHRRRPMRKPTMTAKWAFYLCVAGLLVLSMLVLKGCHL